MPEDPTPYNLAAIRDLLRAAFDGTDLNNLFLYTANPELKPIRRKFSSSDGLDAMVDKTIVYCRNRDLFPDLLAEVQQASPRVYDRFEPRVRGSYIPAPPVKRTADHAYLTHLRQLLAAHLDLEELRALCLDLGVDYDNLSGEGRTSKARELVAYQAQQGRILELVAACAARRPEVPWASRPARAPDADREPGYSHFVSGGLSALAELMRQAPDVRSAVVAFRTDFAAARQQIDVVADYKDVHDLLHELQFSCYNPIVAEVKGSQKGLALDILLECQIKLEEITDGLQDVAERAPLALTDTSLIRYLVKAQEALGKAIEESSAEPLKRARWELGRALAQPPVRINERLNAAAGALRLPSLVKAMIRISDNLARLDLDPGKVEEFETGVDNLVGLNDSLTVLVVDHNQWQGVDAELRRIEGTMGQDTIEIEMSWPDLKAEAEPLHSGRTERWAERLREESDRLDRAIASGDPIAIKRYFGCYRSRAGRRFHNVDVNLKRLCVDLRHIGGPLAAVMGVMG